MHIEIRNNGYNSVTDYQSYLKNYIRKSQNAISCFETVKKYIYNLSGGAGSLSAAADSITSRIKTDKAKNEKAQKVLKKSEEFVSFAKRTDRTVAINSIKARNEFYRVNPWARPKISVKDEKSFWDKAKDWFSGVCNKVSNAAKSVGNALVKAKNKVDSGIKGATNAVVNTFKKAKNTVKNFASNTFNKVKSVFSNAVKAVKKKTVQMFKSSLAASAAAFSAVAVAFKNIFKKSKKSKTSGGEDNKPSGGGGNNQTEEERKKKEEEEHRKKEEERQANYNQMEALAGTHVDMSNYPNTIVCGERSFNRYWYDENGVAHKNCTWYAACRYQQINGNGSLPMNYDNGASANGGDWYLRVNKDYYDVYDLGSDYSVIKPNSLACSYTNGYGKPGTHVVYIEGVATDSNGKTFVYYTQGGDLDMGKIEKRSIEDFANEYEHIMVAK